MVVFEFSDKSVRVSLASSEAQDLQGDYSPSKGPQQGSLRGRLVLDQPLPSGKYAITGPEGEVWQVLLLARRFSSGCLVFASEPPKF